MSRQDANAAFARSSFLYGGNAAYIEQLQARYEKDPNSVDAEWQAFFHSLKDDKAAVAKNAEGASWQKPNWPLRPRDELTASLDGQWPDTERRIGDKIKKQAQSTGVDLSASDVQQAARDSIHALMMIRAYRMRGHLAADLDPLRLRKVDAQPELDPASYGFGPQDYDRPIFIDNVLGMERATIRQMLEILKRTYC